MSNNILNKAVKLEEGMNVTFPLWKTSEDLKLPQVNPKTYNINCGRITFVDESGNIFAIPAINGAVETLISEGYERNAEMHVFFSSGEAYPTEYKEKWDSLLKEMRAA